MLQLTLMSQLFFTLKNAHHNTSTKVITLKILIKEMLDWNQIGESSMQTSSSNRMNTVRVSQDFWLGGGGDLLMHQQSVECEGVFITIDNLH